MDKTSVKGWLDVEGLGFELVHDLELNLGLRVCVLDQIDVLQVSD